MKHIIKTLLLLSCLLFTACFVDVDVAIENSDTALSIDATTPIASSKKLSCAPGESTSKCSVSFDVYYTAGSAPSNKLLGYTTTCTSVSFTPEATKTRYVVTGTESCSFTAKLISRSDDCTTFPCLYYVSPIHGNMAGGANTGVAGADSICTTLGPSNGTTFKAMIGSATRYPCTSDECATGGVSENRDWPLSANTTYYRPDGTEIGTTGSYGVFPEVTTNSVVSSNNSNFWFGIGKKYTVDADHTCGNWTATTKIKLENNKSVNGGDTGDAYLTDPTETVGYRDCDSAYGLVCVATGNTTKKIFVTATTYSGNLGGVTGADAKCAADANKPSTGTYKALIADGTARIACTTANCGGGATEHTSWVLAANKQYSRTDGTVIGTTNSAGIFNFTTALNNAIATTSANVWTGLAADWTTSSDCADFTTSVSPPNYGAIGDKSATDSTAIKKTLTSGCDNSYSLYCVEQ